MISNGAEFYLGIHGTIVKMSDKILQQVDNGLTTWDEYRSALQRAEDGRAMMDTILKPLDFILTPAASGEAPKTLGILEMQDSKAIGLFYTCLLRRYPLTQVQTSSP